MTLASLSHCTRGGYKNLPLSPPTTHHQIPCTTNVGALEHETRRFLSVRKIAKRDRRIRMFEKSEQKNRRSTAISQKRHRIGSFTERTDDYIEERVFENFQNFREPRFKMLEPRFWVFSPPSGKGVNTRTDNLKVHTAGFDTRTSQSGPLR